MGKYDSGYEKMPKDFYATPHAVTQAILVAEHFGTLDRPYDPCAGEGHIIDAAAELGVIMSGSDLRDLGGRPVADFLTVRWLPADCNTIITNPPYGDRADKLAQRFIEHSLKLTKPKRGKVIMLLPVNFDCAKTRQHLFDYCPEFVRKWTLTDRIRWANLEQKEAGPKENHAWFVWSWQRLPGGTQQKYIHGTGE